MKFDLQLSPAEIAKQEAYKTARTSGTYDSIWKNTGKCVLCDLKDKYVVFEEHGIVMTISLYPYIDGHFMIVPRTHVKSPKDLSAQQWETVRKFTYIAKKMIKKTTGIKSMQLVFKDGAQAQATVNGHMHIHCVPFDSADLSVWNYRELEYSPLENATRYKSIAKDIIKNKLKFEDKYAQTTALPIVCDVLIKNSNGEILFEKRKQENKFYPDIITLPGGHIDRTDTTLEEELKREVIAETGINISISKLALLASRIHTLKSIKTSSHLKIKFPQKHTFLWNTYVLKDHIDEKHLLPGDEVEDLIWLSKEDALKREDVTEEVKDIILSFSNTHR